MKLSKFVLLLVAINSVIFLSFFIEHKVREKKTRLSNVPADSGVSEMVYIAEESWGFGPGGNETGIIVYELPQSTAAKIIEEGKIYLESTRQRYSSGNDWRGRYETWLKTPVLLEGDGGGPNRTSDHEIAHYLDKYGFGIPIEPEIEREINEALSNPGSYLAYGRVGFILVIPKANKVVYAYNG